MGKPLKLTFIADTHHYSQTLGITGHAYELRSGSDQKCLAETGAIIDAAFAKLAASDTAAVMIAGDVSNDGERVSHEEFREKLCALQRSKPVYVITATHDWCSDQNPRRFEGDTVMHDVPVLASNELRDFYADFGPKNAVSEFITHLGTCSYTVDLSDDVRLLALNDDQSGNGGAGFSEEHFQWIENQLRLAKEEGKTVLGMQHHLLMPHVHKLITGGGTCVKDREYVASRLADAGLKYVFVGHSHIQDIMRFTSPAGNTIAEVNVGSLVGYPAPIVNVTVENGEVTVDTQYLDCFDYNGVQDADRYLREHAENLIYRVIEGAAYCSKKEFSARLTALQLPGEKLAKYHCLIRPAARLINTATTKKAYRILNAVTLGRVLSKKDMLPFADKPVKEFIGETVCSLFDGCRVTHPANSEYCRLVCGVISIPSRLFKRVGILQEINECAFRLITGNELNDYPTKL